ncbi:hypothetical protein EHP00_356 [Ecytonucleospora hepatopenaei]|uniref:Glutaredoxin domain-containing protein n=1 Tax=Ecytonucleospora hepatopenaei TaxID=646526 RepID=A0A1W0E984_9MICR|nr:hypothetical protein EHP00_356 [Ecytonucleospora hepatopenaei]
MNLCYFFNLIFTVINDERSFEEKVGTNLFVLVYYDKCKHKCLELKKAIEYLSQKYYLIDVKKDADAAKKLNQMGVTAESQYPVMFVNANAQMDPYNSKEVEEKLSVVLKEKLISSPESE